MRWSEAADGIDLTGSMVRVRLVVNGRVQGVGFRPTVYRYAKERGLGGFVKNTNEGVVIELKGRGPDIESFGKALLKHPPPLAVIESLSVSLAEPAGGKDFRILESEVAGKPGTLYPVDTAVCADCLREMRDPEDRRYRYPFINCTNCGPRFTIIEGLPYDRPLTTMNEFGMDPYCRTEYTDPANRRFHAEPVSCPGCGPVLELVSAGGDQVKGDPVVEAVRLLKEGRILAIKGLGGYHLSCLACEPEPVAKLRRRKKRPAKPFAVMFRDIGAVERFCLVNEKERELLLSPRSPIVILKKKSLDTRGESALEEVESLPEEVAPRNGYIGAFLPYTPLHHLLFENIEVLVMTSANFTDEPLISTEQELEKIMGGIADYALTNNRRIAHKCDDSIYFVPGSLPVPLRRARGYVPEPLYLEESADDPDSGGKAGRKLSFTAKGPAKESVLALGGQEKGAFALTKGDSVFVSAHLGDLADIRSQQNYRRELEDFQKMLHVTPQMVVRDMHPDYFTSRLAGELEAERVIEVQHHHAHAVSVMAEYGLREPVLAVSFDGTGYGGDGTLWGGEFLLAGYGGFERLAHIKYLPLTGGEKAVEEPWRMALMHLRNLYGDGVLEASDIISRLFRGKEAGVILDMAARGVNSIPTSSIGRLFDAVSFLVTGISRASFEGEAPIALEEAALKSSDTEKRYRFDYVTKDTTVIDPAPLFEAMLADIKSGAPSGEMASAFHHSVADMTVDILKRLSREHDCSRVVVSGGVFQNRFLCESLMKGASPLDLELYFHRKVPPNDGGISLGQARVGIERIITGSSQA